MHSYTFESHRKPRLGASTSEAAWGVCCPAVVLCRHLFSAAAAGVLANTARGLLEASTRDFNGTLSAGRADDRRAYNNPTHIRAPRAVAEGKYCENEDEEDVKGPHGVSLSLSLCPAR